jgi:hypothetical protein
MPAVSIKLPEQTLAQAREDDAFDARALRARKQVLASGEAIDGQAFAQYLKAKARGQASTRPAARDMTSLLLRPA